MKIAIPKETHQDENRITLLPELAEKLVGLGAVVSVEAGVGGVLCGDDEYRDKGVLVERDREGLLASADMVLRIRKPERHDIEQLKPNCIHVSYLDPFQDPETIAAMIKAKVTAVSVEMIPRITRAQKMDVLSSQASLAGYAAVTLAADRLNKIFPMMMTPAGTIAPSRVFVIGAGVAGLQAIATAQRLGARIEAFDTRPVVEEQVQSLGAKFVKIDLGETGQTADGYAKALTPEQLAKQRDVMAKHCELADVVITTAQVFGRKAPVIITSDMIGKMKAGSLIVDLAVESGGNVEGSKLNEEVNVNGVSILGLANMPGRHARHASQMLGSNYVSLVSEYWDPEKGFQLNLDDDILSGCVITHQGQIVNKKIGKG